MAETLKAHVVLAWILVFVATVTAFLVQDLFMLWPVVSALVHLGYRWGRIDQFHQDQQSIKIN